MLAIYAILGYANFMRTFSDADRVREYSAKNYVGPARARGDSTFQIVAGEVQKGVHLTNRVPLVCQALRSNKFTEENGLVLEKVEGPPSGLSTKATFTYRFETPKRDANAKDDWPFLQLRGIAKDIFASLGGGEEFLRQERENFYGPLGDPADRS